ncbi:hypothetical protein BpHYR1_011025 [Brachionus plicatilis]|uniref:GIY-YIG domain-containing protein n=1 Tax=Brachionus plicatilis TaxID=10195 RepID=A0A3M7SBB7_BRAPC|nr:hypothetical protein BpHYR1_011025 [Brachionus plicatilis]
MGTICGPRQTIGNTKREQTIQKIIFKLQFKKCNLFYIGQTKRSFNTRIREHLRFQEKNLLSILKLLAAFSQASLNVEIISNKILILKVTIIIT